MLKPAVTILQCCLSAIYEKYEKSEIYLSIYELEF